MTELGHLGHFLKGSSAQLGLRKVQEACRKIQELGTSGEVTSRQKAEEYVKSAKEAFVQTETFLRRFFGLGPKDRF